jgi:uncharacterized membrane protein YfcA
MEWLMLSATGLLAGFLGGLFGVGGGAVMVPLLVWFLARTQQQAQGISLAVILLPTALPAVIQYQRAGNLDWKAALWVAAGFLGGGWIGGALAQGLPQADLKRYFGAFLTIIGLRILLWR